MADPGTLKAELGLGVESWSATHGDHGCDAYFDGELAFPARIPTRGPFVFQVKFVEHASARGGDPTAALLSAVRKEVARIKLRQQRPLARWDTPAHYALITNTPLDPKARGNIQELFTAALPETTITVLGAADVCDLIDAHPSLRRSFPQLLSLRDLNALLADAVSRDLLERSRAAIDASRNVVVSFVPTTAYERTWSVLRSHHFAVLYGPPEMGKTAIAWMVALAQLSQGWEAFVCQSPDEFFRLFSEERSSQVFVADDAFGRTEYDPASTLLWERDLPYILPRLDQKHWLILTSRRHLLERARQQMDLQGAAARFPTPASVLIDAGKLSSREKALMLYRHARRATKIDAALKIVRENAWEIVNHASFTPERIRRFVDDRLPELAQLDPPLDRPRLQAEIAEAIRNPTRGMQLAFKALAEPYKWFLISLLEAGYWATVSVVRVYYEDHCPSDAKMPFEDIQDQLLEAFIRWADSGSERLTWVHPSCRDLVIDELVADEHLRHRFLATASLEGLELAFSVMGGPEGNRNLPLMVDEPSWSLVEHRVASLAPIWQPSKAAALLTSLKTTLMTEKDEDTRLRVSHILAVACNEVREAWDEQQAELTAEELEAFASSTVLLDPLPSLPSIRSSWIAATQLFENELESAKQHFVFEPDSLTEWVNLAVVISQSEPRFLARSGFPKAYASQIESCLRIAQDDLTSEPAFDKPSEMREEASRLIQIANSLDLLATLAPEHSPQAKDLAGRLVTKASALEDQANEEDEPEPDDDDARDSRVSDLDIRLIFSDLY